MTKEAENKSMPFSPEGDIIKVSDEDLANLHRGGWKDRYSIQANVEMSRRLRDAIEKFNKQSSKYSKILIWLTAIMTVAVGIQIYLLLK